MKLSRILIRGVKIILYALLGIIVLLFVIYFSPALWKNWVTYPRLEEQRAALWKQYKKPGMFITLNSYRGVIHSHSYWSHDSRGTLAEIMEGAKKAKFDFIFFADHAHNKLDTLPRGYRGVFDGIILEAGTEGNWGLMVTPFDSVVIDWSQSFDSVVNQVVSHHGLVTYVHSEKKHPWENPNYQAMEIYNIHSDFLDEKGGYLPLVINNIVNGKNYKHWSFREIYDDQTAILANWDSINHTRRVTGIAGVDAHNNNNFRARYTEDGLVEWVGPNAKTISVKESNWLDKLLLSEPDKHGWAYKWELDPYFNSFNYVNDHVFSDTFSNVGIKENIIKGHVFIAFESLAMSDGFQYFATDDHGNVTAILGDSISKEQASNLKAVSPYPVKFKLFKQGEVVKETEAQYEFEYDVQNNAGNYRIVAYVNLDDKWVPWIFTNPIYIH